MKIKTFYHVIVETHSGKSFENPLKANELYLISKLLETNKSVHVSKHKVSESFYKSLFS